MPLYALLMLPLLLVRFSAILSVEGIASPDGLVPDLLVNSNLPAILVGIIAVAILVASMSSGDTILHGAGSIAVHDGLKSFMKFEPKQEVLLIRIAILAFLSLCYFGP